METYERLLTPSEVAELLATSEITLSRWRRDGQGPPWIRLGIQVRYRRSCVESWLDDQTTKPGSDSGLVE